MSMSRKLSVFDFSHGIGQFELYNGEILGPDYKVELRFVKDYQPSDYTGGGCKIAIIGCNNFTKPPVDLHPFDLVIVINQETLHYETSSCIRRLQKHFNNEKIIAVAGGHRQTFPPNDPRVYFHPWLLLQVPVINGHQQLRPFPQRRRKFDVLLGQSKPFRDAVFEYLKQQDLLDQCYVNLTTLYYGGGELRTIYRTPELDELEDELILQGMDKTNGVLKSALPIDKSSGPACWISQWISWKIYDNTCYTVVTETAGNDYTFFTEKTGKPLHVGRPFVFVGSSFQMRELRRMGFQTFHPVIDETYDTIEDNQQRHGMAMRQIQALSQASPAEIYSVLADRLEHNRRHLADRELWNKPLREWLIGHIESVRY